MFPRLLLALALLLLSFSPGSAADPAPRRTLFLGDSITYSGQYSALYEAHCLASGRPADDILNLGLPSETVSGLSEEGHADGKFPRPDLHERLARVLAQTKPQLVFACYGMNDGIYLPVDPERFAKFQDGMRKLHDAVTATGAQIIHLTPPVFDPVPLGRKSSPDGKNGPYTGYDEFLAQATDWLLAQQAAGWKVIDLHTPMAAALKTRRAQDPAFAFAKDGVHASDDGHQVLATALLQGLGEPPRFDTVPPAVLKLIRQRQRVRTDAWLTACGHQRPGMAKGLPLPEAEAKAQELSAQITAALRAPIAP